MCMHIYIYIYGCDSKQGFVAVPPPPPSATYLCRGPSFTNSCRWPLCRVL